MKTVKFSTPWVSDDQLPSSFPTSMMDIYYYEPQDMIDVDYYDGQDMEDIDYYDGQDMEDIDYYDGQDMEGVQIFRTRRRYFRIVRRSRNAPSDTTSTLPLELQKPSLGGLVESMNRLSINDSIDMEVDDTTKEDPEIMTDAKNATALSVIPVTYYFGVEEKRSSTKRSSFNERRKTMAAKRRNMRARSL